MNKSQKLKRIRAYPKAYLKDYETDDFEIQMIESRQRMVLDAIAAKKPAVVIEIGCGVDLLYHKASRRNLPIQKWIIVEPITKFAHLAKKVKQTKIELSIIQDFFEDSVGAILAVTKKPVDFIICSGMLHEVPNPKALLKAAHDILGKNGTLHINVPNAQSLHRRLAKAMGLIKNLKEFSKRNRTLMQRQVFDMQSLKSLLAECHFATLNTGGYFIKPFSNQQMTFIRKILTPEVLDGLWALGKEIPELANEIYINARAEKTPAEKLHQRPIASWTQWFDSSAQYYKDPRMKMAYYDNGKPVPMKVLRTIHNDVWKKLGADQYCTLLDIGCGVGLFTKAFQGRLRQIVGIDKSPAMIREALRKNPKNNFLVSDISSLPFRSQSFDRILCYSVFHYLSSVQMAKIILDELLRVITPSGSILIGDILLPQNSRANAPQKKSSWWPKELTHNLKKKTFPPSFFINYCKKTSCHCNILPQNIPGKSTAASRYDVILKPGG